MASVALRTLWLNDAADLTDALSLPGMSSLSVASQAPGAVRRMANGRLRSVSRAGQARTVDATFDACTRAEIAWLDAHVGRIVLIRDDRGRKLFGIYYEVPVDEHQYDDQGDVNLTLTEVTFSEAVA